MKNSRVDNYIELRVRELLADGWEHSRIVQLLEAIAWIQGAARPKKYVEDMIQKVSAA